MRKYRSSYNPFEGRSTQCKLVTVGLGAFFVVLVITLLAWGIPKALQKDPAVSVLLPLYVYPTPGAWDPVYNAASQYPGLQFIVVVNPNDGPVVNSSTGEADYFREIPKLNSYKNIRTIGYVPTNYAKRPVNDVYSDINIWASWAENTTADISMQGIFFDECPNTYTAEIGQFMQQIDTYAKNSTGFGNFNYVVHNPGSIPSDNRLFSGADLVVVFEDTYAAYNLDHRSQNLSQLPAQNINNYQRNNFAYLMNSIPSNWGVSDFTTFIKQSEGGAQYMFMTDLSISQGVNVYAQFGSDWGNFIDAMGNLNGQ